MRNYKSSDYQALVELYKQFDLYGGQFDENRDSETRIANKIKNDPEAILIAEQDGKIIGTVSLIEDDRVAWLFRFAVSVGDTTSAATKLLYEKAIEILKERGHGQVLVYASTKNTNLENRYTKLLGFEKGAEYICYWKNI